MDHNVCNNSDKKLAGPVIIPLRYHVDSQLAKFTLRLILIIPIFDFRAIKEETIADGTILGHMEFPMQVTVGAIFYCVQGFMSKPHVNFGLNSSVSFGTACSHEKNRGRDLEPYTPVVGGMIHDVWIFFVLCLHEIKPQCYTVQGYNDACSRC